MARSKRTVKTIISIADLQPDPHNANKGTIRGRAMLEDSLGKYGAGRSILVDADGVTIAGKQTLESAAEKDFPIRVVQTDGHELVVVQRTDLNMATDAKAKALAIADNRIVQVNLDWDIEALAALNAKTDLSQFWNDDELGKLLNITDQFKPIPPEKLDRLDERSVLECPCCHATLFLDHGKLCKS